MEEKKSPKQRFAFWSIPNLRRPGLSFLGRFRLPSSSSFPGILSANHKSIRGFTLIELLVVIMILSVLVVAALTILNPLTQIKKGQDTQRQHDLKQLQTALDSYYNDNSYYPQSPAALVEVKNIQTVPNDPVASSAWPNYGYVKDINNNPQWDVLFAKLAFPSSSSLSCPLEKMQSCLPENYRDLGYNYCVISGDVECERIVSMTVTPLPIYTPSIINTPTPTQEVTPSPPPFVCYCRDATYFYDPTKEINHQCGVVATTSDPNLNRDFYCSPPVGGLGPCINPCTQ